MDIKSYWIPQDGPQSWATICPAREIFFGGTRGGGKGMPKSAELLTNFGIRHFSDARVGMQICNPDGTVSKIIGVYPRGPQPIFKFTFDDGATCEADADHIWINRWSQHKLKADRRYLDTGEHVRWRLSTTTDLIDALGKGKKIRIPLCKPVAFTQSRRYKTEIDPYLLGLLLGDGCLTLPRVSISTDDAEIAEFVEKNYFRKQKDPRNLILLDGDDGISDDLRRLKLRGKYSHNKFVPDIFKFSKPEIRLALLQGLLDTDGYADQRGHIQFVSVSKQLALDVQFLVRSLGGKATLTSKIGSYKDEYGAKHECREAFMLYIQHPDKASLFRLSRKRERCVGKEWNGGHELTRRLESIEFDRIEETTCIQTDHPNGLYLTNDFIVTHNTDGGIGRQVLKALQYGYRFRGLMIRKKYKDLAKIRQRWDELIREGLPAIRVGGSNQVNYIRFENGAEIEIAAVGNVKTLDDYQGQELQEITIDEAPNLPFINECVDRMKGCLRSPKREGPEIPCSIFLTGNPGGPASSVIKMMYIYPERPGTEDDPEIVPEGEVWYVEKGVSRVFIKSTLSDNKYLGEDYYNMINSISDVALRKAWVEGDWNVFVGQAFNFGPRHIIPPIWPIPSYAPLYMSMDYGFGAPFSIGWWWMDADNRAYRFHEWYGCESMRNPGKGLRLPDEQIAKGILEIEKKLGISSELVTRILSPDCFNRKANYMGGGQGPSTAEVFSKEPFHMKCRPGDPSRELKIRQFRQRLWIPEKITELPQMVVYEGCKHFIRTIPTIQIADDNPEYIEKGGEDHCFEEAALLCMARPVSLDVQRLQQDIVETKRKEKEAQLDSASRAALHEQQMLWENVRALEEREDEMAEQFLEKQGIYI